MQRLIPLAVFCSWTTTFGLTVFADNDSVFDRGKVFIESDVEKIVATNAIPKLDVSKRGIESVTERTVEVSASSDELLAATTDTMPASDLARNLDNPRVKPGNIRWHANFLTACRRAEESKKPVLLFQLMGQLDQRFT